MMEAVQGFMNEMPLIVWLITLIVISCASITAFLMVFFKLFTKGAASVVDPDKLARQAAEKYDEEMRKINEIHCHTDAIYP